MSTTELSPARLNFLFRLGRCEIHLKPIQLAVTALLAGFLTAGCASSGHTDSQLRHLEAQAQIERRIQEIFAAAQGKDFNRLDSYHLYGPSFTKFTGSSPERLDAVTARKGEHDGLGAINGLKMRADGLKVDVFGNAAIATFTLNYSFESNGQTIDRKERTSLIFVRDGGDWKITHEHLSPIKP